MPKVAIALQGGGSHAAFAAGVLLRLLSPERRDHFQLVALSGTSGGAVCASLVWRGLVSSGPQEASERLVRFWRDLEVHDVLDAITNFWAVSWARSPFTFEVSPYQYEPVAEPAMLQLLQRHLDLEQFTQDRARRAKPKLFMGATDVLSGRRTIFEGETIIYKDVIASAAVPPLFRAVPIDRGLYWDGLFATNPPVREFTNLPDESWPDEIWVVQLNPQLRKREPRSIRDIIDRRNELAGNLSLGQELYFVHTVNEMIDKHGLRDYDKIRIRLVELDVEGLDYPSKLDRRQDFVESLIRHGRERADWFFEDRSLWRAEDNPLAKSFFPRHERERAGR
jgi:NTE family protein